ncbi:hypothetical protein LTR56_023990 [Elasticomyces elasticus]|nr:hypothetical protein LTR56_023990 [Elasticomyces elasticus]KAK3632198.1 hypothetical protein LTR22_020710 [Elasticomyces elasticus]KAK4906319.1 hypothetical protein LTR49_024517 [Elasticomyces elasticus]KAK5744303.1 hypothetical protein LTS12_023520 [Elasticomyces elasticus]
MFNPFGIVTNGTSPWQAEPTVRGTYGILSTCLLTMILCIWTAVHLNMEDGRNAWMQTGRKSGWLIIGLFAPELVAWTAFQQNKDAVELTRYMETVLEQKRTKNTVMRWLENVFCCVTARKEVATGTKAENYELLENGSVPEARRFKTRRVKTRRHPWTIVHSHFALMGGFAIDLAAFDENIVPGKPERLRLTVDGVKLLANVDSTLLPDISREAIQDKSKASPLAKTIVCLQALWFCVQCITRLVQGLSISLLELNTFAHALCAFVIYGLWWSKPLNVEEPILLQGEGLERWVAALVMLDMVLARPLEFSHGFDTEYGHGRRKTALARAKLTFNRPLNKYPDDKPVLMTDAPNDATKTPRPGLVILPKEFRFAEFSPFHQHKQKHALLSAYDTESNMVLLKSYHHLHGFRIVVKSLEPAAPRPDSSVWLTQNDVRCMKLACEVAVQYPSMAAHIEEYPSFSTARIEEYPRFPTDDTAGAIHLVIRSKNWPWLGTWNSSGVQLHSKAILAGFTLAGVVYGMIHLSAWNAPFPSVSQMWLWRASAITLISSPVFLIIGLMGDYDANESDGNVCSLFCAPFSFAFMVIGVLCYITARAYLVVECFIGLSHLPPDAFLVPHWSRYFPHIM